jgi:hypothetical protein
MVYITEPDIKYAIRKDPISAQKSTERAYLQVMMNDSKNCNFLKRHTTDFKQQRK